MTWLEARELLEKFQTECLEELEKRGAHLADATDQTTTRDDALKWSKEADSQIVLYLQDYKWREPISLEILTECAARFGEGLRLADLVLENSQSIPKNHKSLQVAAPDLLQWVLIDYWNKAGLFRVMYDCFSPSSPYNT
jgi:hypothetical protein